MTAEILIMNKSAIAMAADSVITVGNQKTYTGVNKLFMLSNNPPMGIMIYDSADFMNIPLESLIKEFRSKYGNELNNVQGFMTHFLEFIRKFALENRGDFQEYFENSLNDLYNQIKMNFIFFNELKKDPNSVVHKVELSGDYKKSFFNSEIFKKYNPYFKELAEKDFDDNDEEFKNLVVEIYKKLYVINYFNHTGIVIAGFNKGEIFPSFSAYDIYSIFEDECKFFKEISSKDNSSLPLILPFAQTDVVENFIWGTNNNFLKDIFEIFKRVFESYPFKIIDVLEDDTEIQKECFKHLKRKINDIVMDKDEFIRPIEVFLESYAKDSLSPIYLSISALPKEELGNMCESLIHLTSLKRKVDEGLETVGGDVDVAIISKGDGFIWGKRKHYFDSNLNSQFFERKKINKDLY